MPWPPPPCPRPALIAHCARADKTEPTLSTESTEKADPAEPSDSTEPVDPMDKIEPADPIDKIEPTDPIDKIEPAEPMDSTERVELIDCEVLLVGPIWAFSQALAEPHQSSSRPPSGRRDDGEIEGGLGVGAVPRFDVDLDQPGARNEGPAGAEVAVVPGMRAA